MNAWPEGPGLTCLACLGDLLQPVFGVQDLGAQALQPDLWLQVILTPREQIEKGETLRCGCSSL